MSAERGTLPWKSSGWPWNAVLTMCLTMSFVHRGLLNVLISPIENDIGLSDLQLGEIQGPAFTILFALASIFFGRGADSFERRYLLLGSTALLILGALVTAFSDSFVSISIGRMVVGAGAAALMPLGASLIPDLFDERRVGVAFGVFLAGAVFGDALSVVFGGWALAFFSSGLGRTVSAFAPWREVVLLAAIPLIVGLPFMLVLREPTRELTLPDTDGSQRSQSLSFLTRNWRLYFPYALSMTAASVLGAASYWVPEVLQRDYGMTSAQVAARYGATLLVSALSGAAIGIVAGRFFTSASRGFAVTSFAYALIAFAFLSFLTKYANVCLAAIAFFVIADAATSVMLISSIQTVTPPRLRGVTASLDRLFGVSIGYSIGQPLVGLVATHFQGMGVKLAGAMLIVAIPAGLVASVLLLLTAVASRRFGQA